MSCWFGFSASFERVGELALPAVAVAAGAFDTCAIDASGALWCWDTPGSSPVEVALPGKAISTAVGHDHTCAVTAANELWCWGSNEYGQLGTGGASASLPVHVASSVRSVAAGGFHTCVLELDGSVWCWGENSHGQLGNGSTTNSSVPIQVTGLGASATWISAGGWHTCARKIDGTLWCWGENRNGQLGDGTTINRPEPVQVAMP